ncbi:uncharacterized protein LOC116840577 [Odontomachus brunneus]|uniref:uncharacterized protein LOC116840577 n=1 Tax=Odontomachus brunneus TaxID=486640 RepID=UPI0013F18308|nr:uncharacterized protein LOC116840577 [Odontomachus brunneus]
MLSSFDDASREWGIFEEGPTLQCTPIKIETTQGQVTLGTENFPESVVCSTRALRSLPYACYVAQRPEECDSLVIRKMKKILISVLLLAVSVTATYIPDSAQQQKDASQLQDCNIGNWNVNCFLIRAIIGMRKMQQSKDIEVADGVTFVQEKPVEVSGRQVSEKDILSQLPQNNLARTMQLTNMLCDAGTSLLNSHSLKFGMSVDHPVEEARTKMKKHNIILLAILFAIKIFLLMPMIGLSLITLKAFFFSKLALLSGVAIAFQKFINNNNDSVSSSFFNKDSYLYNNDDATDWTPNNSNQVTFQNKESVTTYDYARANDNYDAHDLAYVNYARSHNNAN